MEFNALTKLKDIMDSYPWLKDEIIKLDSRFKIVDSPIGKMMLKKATIQDAADKSGYSVEDLIAKLKKMIEDHKE